MIIDCISDLHGEYPVLQGGDLLIVAGDMTASNKVDQWDYFFCWLGRQQYKKKLYIGGNHDNFLQQLGGSVMDYAREVLGLRPEEAEYLCDSGVQFEGLKIWGSPWTSRFFGQNEECMAFSFWEKELLCEKFDLIPEDTDILITHSPPNGILDETRKNRVGSYKLLNVVQKIKPKLHVFGHIHEGHGQLTQEGTIFVNASYVDGEYEPVNSPIRIEL